ncbi:hypothetical protein D3C86_2170150 [compost metagenome]
MFVEKGERQHFTGCRIEFIPEVIVGDGGVFESHGAGVFIARFEIVIHESGPFAEIRAG